MLLRLRNGVMLKPEEALHEYQQDINEFMQGYALGYVSAVHLWIAHAPVGRKLTHHLNKDLNFFCRHFLFPVSSNGGIFGETLS
jgi:hypothetical protein